MKELMYDVFISYSRKDYVDDNNQIIPDNIVSKVKESLAAANISFWFDEEGIFTGDSFAHIIVNNIKESRVFLFISTKNANESIWTSSEIATAHTFKKKIIPLKCDDSVYNDAVILYIAALDYVEYYKNPEKALHRLVNSIKSYLKQVEQEEGLKRKEKEDKERLAREKQQREEALKRLREQMSSMSAKREDILRKIIDSEATISSLKLELSLIEESLSNLHQEEMHILGILPSPTTLEADNKTSKKKTIKEGRDGSIQEDPQKPSAIDRFFNGIKKDWSNIPRPFKWLFFINLLIVYGLLWDVFVNAQEEDFIILSFIAFPLLFTSLLRVSNCHILGFIEMLLVFIYIIGMSSDIETEIFIASSVAYIAIFVLWLLLPFIEVDGKRLYRRFSFCGGNFWQIWKRPITYLIIFSFLFVGGPLYGFVHQFV